MDMEILLWVLACIGALFGYAAIDRCMKLSKIVSSFSESLKRIEDIIFDSSVVTEEPVEGDND